MAPDFQCLRCGNCCQHAGEVRLATGEAEQIAAFLGLDIASFTDRYTRLSGDRHGLSLTEHSDAACVFLGTDPFACRIQAVKPAQCRSFPIGWRYEDLETVCKASRASGNNTVTP